MSPEMAGSLSEALEQIIGFIYPNEIEIHWSILIVVYPYITGLVAGAFILVFIPATRELSSAIFLYTTGTQVLSVLLFDKSDEGNFEVLSSMGLILVVVTVALVLVGFRMVGRDFLLRRTAT